MSFSVVFRRLAKREFDDAVSWYEDRREGLGREFSVAVERLLEKIALSPNQFACLRGNIRRAVLKRFPYSIHFVVEDNRILVLAIFHARRDQSILRNDTSRLCSDDIY
jgi:plasmid stabilization system protein ParE